MRAFVKITLSKSPRGMVKYRYAAHGSVYIFHTLAEVGARFQPMFRAEIQRLGWEVEFSRDIEYPPWVADYVVAVNTQPTKD